MWKNLQSLASLHGLTRANVLLTAYAEVLATWSKTRKFTLNLTFFQRLQGHPQINEVIGDFTSLILLQVEADGHLPFQARAKQIQKQLWMDMEHRYFSGVRVLRELSQRNPEKERILMPIIFTSNLGYENIGPENSGLALPGKMVYGISQTPQVWLDNQISESDGDLIIVWDAVEELFPHQMLDDMFAAYLSLLRLLGSSEDAWQTVPELKPTAQIQRQNAINSSVQPVCQKTLNNLFDERAEQQPDKIALMTTSKSICYGELKHSTSAIAALLAKEGAAVSSIVAVVMEKGWEQVVASIGILKTGAAYLPIDPSVPQERLQYILEDCKVTLVLTQSWLVEKLAWPENVKLFSVDTCKYVQSADEPLQVKQSPSDLAYIIHTSGSTGIPKGVMIDHQGAVNTIQDINSRFKLSPEDAVFALSNLNFDLSVYDIFGTLAAGATIVIPDHSLHKAPEHWLSLMKAGRVTVWNSVPTMMQMLVEYVQDRKVHLFDSLRLVLLSGDWIPLDLPEKIRAHFTPNESISLGGATEASIWSILYPIKDIEPEWSSIPYGRPMLNQSIHVLNENMTDCPDWVFGQLYIGGIGLAKGYWQDEEKTKSSFIQHPDTGVPLYRTGDFGRFLPDGTIEFLGREDQQMKLNGYRIELGEIEMAMTQCPGVKQAVVTVITDSDKKQRLIGYIIPDGDISFSENDVKNYLKGKLITYMIPNLLIKLDNLPLNSNGKIDRKKLPMPDMSELNNPSEYFPPENQLELSLANVIQSILNIDKLSTRELFMNVGANSIDMVKIQNALSKELSINVSIVDIFEYSSIHRLAVFISNKQITNNSLSVQEKVLARKNASQKRQLRSRTAL